MLAVGLKKEKQLKPVSDETKGTSASLYLSWHFFMQHSSRISLKHRRKGGLVGLWDG